MVFLYLYKYKNKGEVIVSTKEANIALLSVIPESEQQKIFIYLSDNYFKNNPFKPLSSEEIYNELAEAREYYKNGFTEDFDEALDEIGAKYGL